METKQKETKTETTETMGTKEEIFLQKQRIQTFDKQLVTADEEKTFAYKFLYIFMGIFGSFLMVFPVGPAADPDLKVIHILAWMFLGMAVIYRLQPYVYVVGMGRISEILAYTPVNQKLLRQVHRGYLYRYLLKLGAICLTAQQFGALLNGAWSIWNLLYPAGIILSLGLVGNLYLGWK